MRKKIVVFCNWIRAIALNVVLGVSIILCLWAILSIQLNFPLKISISLGNDLCDRLNSVYLNLSYSFFAAFLFYLLTIVIPEYRRSRKIKPILRKRMDKCNYSLKGIVREFSRNLKNLDSSNQEDLCEILNSKSWTDIIPAYNQIYSLNISYIAYISQKGEFIRRQIVESIDLYGDQMSEDQIESLEAFVDMPIWSKAKQFSSMNINLDDPKGKEDLIKDFSKMYYEFHRIYETF